MSVRVLIIEDNPANLQLMSYLLQAFGYAALTACDGEQGIEVAQRERPELIICDIQMPKLDGYEVAKRLKAHPVLRTIPLVAVTALAMVGDRDRVLAAGFDGYIPKPIAPETFVQQVESFLPDDQRPRPRCSVPPSATPSRRATILAVDNSVANTDLARSVLEPFGYRVVSAQGVAEALTLVHDTPPDLILSDVHMPERNGFELIQVVKGDPQLRTIPFVFISSTVWREQDRADGLALGAVKFLLRPMEPQEFLAEIQGCLPAQKVG